MTLPTEEFWSAFALRVGPTTALRCMASFNKWASRHLVGGLDVTTRDAQQFAAGFMAGMVAAAEDLGVTDASP